MENSLSQVTGSTFLHFHKHQFTNIRHMLLFGVRIKALSWSAAFAVAWYENLRTRVTLWTMLLGVYLLAESPKPDRWMG